MNSLKLTSSLWYHFQPSTIVREINMSSIVTRPVGSPGAGAGKGGGAGGSVRESGGGLGKFGAAQEEGYFYSKQREQLEKMKQKMKEEQEIAQKKEE